MNGAKQRGTCDEWVTSQRRASVFLHANVCARENNTARRIIVAFSREGEGWQQAPTNAVQSEEQDTFDGNSVGGEVARSRGRGRQRFCARKVGSELKPFNDVFNKVEDIFKPGHLRTFLSKYHPQVDVIEQCWGYTECFLCLHCEYSLVRMLKILPGVMSGVTVDYGSGCRGCTSELTTRDWWTTCSTAASMNERRAVFPPIRMFFDTGKGAREPLRGEASSRDEGYISGARILWTASVPKVANAFTNWAQKRASAPGQEGVL